MRGKKKVLSLLLSLTLAFTVLPWAALAEEPEKEAIQKLETSMETDLPEDVEWEEDAPETGTDQEPETSTETDREGTEAPETEADQPPETPAETKLPEGTEGDAEALEAEAGQELETLEAELMDAAHSPYDMPLTAETSDGRSITVYCDTNISEIIDILGEPKLTTEPSRWGGSAYSFYTGDYKDYMYFETQADGRIRVYAVVGCNFRCRYGVLGGSRPYTSYATYGYTSLDFASGTTEIWAIAAPNFDMYVQNEAWNEYRAAMPTAIAAYRDDAAVGEGIAHHAVMMWNAVNSYRGAIKDYRGKDVRLAFDSRAFYISRQLLENGSNFYRYSQATGNTAFTTVSASVTSAENTNTSSWYFAPNPLTYASQAPGYSYLMSNGDYLVGDKCLTGEIIGCLSPSYFNEKKDIPLTEEEQARLKKMREMYADSVAKWNEAAGNGTYEDGGDQYQTTPLKAGTVRQGLLEAAVEYLNAIRVGAGLSELELDRTLCEDAQCKAVLNRYMNYKNLPANDPHNPPQPAGVSNEFYAKTKFGRGENLFQGDVLTSIINALDDSMGDRITCGHRYNLLNPSYTKIGLGSCAGQGCHKFDGYSSSAPDAICWPSNGVMMAEAGLKSGHMFTVNFYNGYRTTTKTGVVFKCLNTDETYTFPAGLGNSSSDRGMVVNPSMVSYHDNAIALTPDSVYEITVTNLTDRNGNAVGAYTYRSVYANATSAISGDASLTLSDESLALQQGERHKINAAVLPEDMSNKMVTWVSSNERVAAVTGNGIVTAGDVGTATITARMDNGISASCTVTVRKPDPVRVRAEDVSVSGGSIRLTAVLQNPGTAQVSGTLYAAAYSASGRMTDLRAFTGPFSAKDERREELNLRGVRAKLFFLDDRGSPLIMPVPAG